MKREEFGRWLARMGVGVEAAGRLFGCHHSQISRYLNGKGRPKLVFAQRICRIISHNLHLTPTEQAALTPTVLFGPSLNEGMDITGDPGLGDLESVRQWDEDRKLKWHTLKPKETTWD